MKKLVCHTPQEKRFTLDTTYPVIYEDKEDYIIMDDTGHEHGLSKRPDCNGKSFKTWFLLEEEPDKLKRIPFPTPEKEILGTMYDTSEDKLTVSADNMEKILKIKSFNVHLELDIKESVNLAEKIKYFVETNSSENDMIKVPRGFPNRIFNILIHEEASLFVKEKEEMKQYLQYLWDIEVSTRFKEEVLWNEGFIERLKYWGLDYEKDMAEHGRPKHVEGDDDE